MAWASCSWTTPIPKAGDRSCGSGSLKRTIGSKGTKSLIHRDSRSSHRKRDGARSRRTFRFKRSESKDQIDSPGIFDSPGLSIQTRKGRTLEKDGMCWMKELRQRISTWLTLCGATISQVLRWSIRKGKRGWGECRINGAGIQFQIIPRGEVVGGQLETGIESGSCPPFEPACRFASTASDPD